MPHEEAILIKYIDKSAMLLLLLNQPEFAASDARLLDSSLFGEGVGR